MPKKPKPIPAVPFDVLIKGHEGVIEDEAELGLGEPLVSLVRVLCEEQKPEVILAVSHRLAALAKLLKKGVAKPRTYALSEDGCMVDEAMFRAAARATLFEAKMVDEVSFDHDEFMTIALEESETNGKS